MAKQKGILKLKGTMGDVTFYKTTDGYMAHSKERIDRDNILSATWGILSAAYITQDDDAFGAWFPSGNVDLGCITGSGYIALRYVGSGEEAFDGTYEFDEIVINSN